MKRKNYIKYIFKSVAKDFIRLATIIAIAGLGVGFLIGLLSSTPTLYASVNENFKQANVFDINLKSTIGFSSTTIDKLNEEIDGIDEYAVKQEIEINGKYNDSNLYSRIIIQPISSSKINNINLVEGNLPSEKNQCLLLNTNPTLQQIPLNQEIEFELNGVVEKYLVVGYVDDPYYISTNEIVSNQSAKHLQAIIYLDSKYNEISYVTDICYSFYPLNELSYFSSEYEDQVDQIKSEISNYIANDDLVKTNYREVIYLNVVEQFKNEFRDLGFSEEIIESLLASELTQNRIESEVDSIMENQFDPNKENIYTLSIYDNMDVYGFISNAKKVDLISNIFPIFFFSIAMLVSLSSFSRIISRDRLDIATLKAIGYPNYRIYMKYLSTGFISVFIGCLLGSSIGLFVLPNILYNVYKSLYILPPIVISFQYQYILPISLSMIILILLVVFLTTRRYIKINTANLLVDNISKPGKKILLEKVPFIWNHLKFKYKSMFRNIFMFKKNLIMMILGVGGCSALLLTAFGINNSLSVLTTNQYNEILKYNLVIQTSASEIENIDNYMQIKYYEDGLINDDKIYKTTFISGNESLNQYVKFVDVDTNKTLNFTLKSCFITRQVAEELNIKKNDQITYWINNNQYEFKITNIVENYVGNYLYVGEDLLNQESSTYNALLAYKDFKDGEDDSFIEGLNNNPQIEKVIYTKVYFETYNVLMDNLSGIIGIIIFVSGLLAIIVIYNLVDININERIKKIATLRVIGYQKKEVIMYIFREIFMMSIFGFIVGVIFGVFLHRYIIDAIASPGLIFGLYIQPLSYLYTGLLTVLFSLIVVIICSPKILSINMAEALKSKE